MATTTAGLLHEGGGRRRMILVYLALHLSALWGILLTPTRLEWIVVLALLQVRGFCLSAGYHRLLAHRSFQTTAGFRWLLASVACTALRGGPLWWVAHHRHHHRHSDTKDDIFTPYQGFWWTYCGWLVSGQFDRTDLEQVRDLRSDAGLRWLNRFWLVPSLLLITCLVLVGGWRAFFTVYAISTVVLLHSLAWIDVVNHNFGFQRYETGDESRNSYLVSLLCNGEGWHNNHHHYPASASYGFFWWEVDGTYTGLRLLERMGLVWQLKTPPDTILGRNLLARTGPHAPTDLAEQPVSPSPLSGSLLDQGGDSAFKACP